ncbi:MAG: site-specific integrase [Bacteroidetes bacterium]|nr:MAG: site-specific integrase [Bacteroidota bacterium]
MATTSFVIRTNKANKEGKVPIYAQYCHEAKTALFSTGQRIYPDQWNSKDGKPRRSRKYPELEQVQKIMLKKRAEIEQYIMKANLEGVEPTVAYIRELVRGPSPTEKPDQEPGEVPVKQKSIGFFDLIDTFVENNQHQRTRGTRIVYRSTRKHLLAFQKKKRRKLTFEGMNREFYDAFCGFLFQDMDMSLNTVGKYIKTLKTFLHYAVACGIEVNPAFRKFKVLKEEPEMIYLTQAELDQLSALDLSKTRLKHCRDVFLFACYTGLRFSDLAQLKPEHVLDNHIQFQTQKTRDRLRIPLLPQAKAILERYKGQYLNALPVVSNQKMNDYVKELAQLAGIDTIVETTRTVGNTQYTRTFPKHVLISTHTARRTFITLSLEKGMRPEVVMQITGHKNYKTLMRYVRIVDKVKEEELMKAWGE